MNDLIFEVLEEIRMLLQTIASSLEQKDIQIAIDGHVLKHHRPMTPEEWANLPKVTADELLSQKLDSENTQR